jgi:capsular polysaccharide biosynthesis protein
MNTEELKRYLKSLHVVLENNDEANKLLTAKEYSNFYLTTSGVAIKNLSLIKELLFGRFQLSFFKLYALKHILLSKKVNLKDEKYLIIHNFWSQGYHHWLAEALLKLIVFDADYHDFTLLLPTAYPKFATQSVSRFKFKDIIYLEKQHIYHITKAVIISNPKSGFFSNEHIQKVKDFYITSSPKPFRKIYISRRNEKLRKIVNEEDVYPLLLKKGYEIVEPHLLSFDQQVTMFSEAVEIISIHGAALTNIIFMQPGTKVIELYRELETADKMNLCYYRLAEAAKLDYNIFFLNIAVRNKDIDRSNLIIDKNDFELILTPKQ